MALSNVLYVGGRSPAIACGSAFGAGINGVEFYDPQNIFAYSLPLPANTVAAGTLEWGATNTGAYYSYTGSLRVSLWSTTGPYFGAPTIVDYRMAEVTPNFVGPGAYSSTQLLAGGYSYSATTSLSTVTTPPPGQYCVVMTLEMYSPTGCASGDGYCTMDWQQFQKPAFFN